MPDFLRALDLSSLADQIGQRAAGLPRPFLVAIDGRSGSGKSTLAARLTERLPAALLDGDGFFAGGTALRCDSPEQRAHDCIDWRAQRTVIERLRGGHSASYHAFDWEAFDGSRMAETTIVEARPVILLEGVYSARPELADLLDLRLLLRVSDELRRARLRAREHGLGPWDLQWHEAEEWYFAQRAPLASFDFVVDG